MVITGDGARHNAIMISAAIIVVPIYAYFLISFDAMAAEVASGKIRRRYRRDANLMVMLCCTIISTFHKAKYNTM